jgi:hypothetical protein
MVNTIIIKNDDTSGNTPADNELVTGELAVNTTDGKLFYGDNNGDAQEFAMGGSNQTLTTGNGISGANSGSSGNFTMAVEAAQTTITSILATDLKIGEDDQTKIDFETANKINFYADNEKQLVLEDGAFYPGSDNIIDLGKSDVEFKDAFFDGTVTTDSVSIGGHTINAIDASSEASNANDHLMTALAIKNRIEDFGYTTNTGDVTLSGAQTFTGAKTFQTDTKLLFRDSGLFINSSADGTLKISSDDELSLEADDNVHVRVKDTFVVRENTDDDVFLRVHPDNQTLELFHNDSSANKFKMELAASGATTLSTHDEDGTAGHLTLDIDGNITLDADGGTITFSDNGSSLGTITSSGYSGNAGTATTLATARNIGGVSFNGSANINLPGVNTSGNQDTTGNAATATALATARNIAGQSFDGTGNISIAPTDLTSVTATASEINVLDGFAGATADLTYAKDLRATGVTTTEFDKLDGLTASTSELNIMDGVTATTSELNIMDGVTSTTAELNKLDGFTGDKDDLIYAKDLKATGVTTTEFDKLDGLTASTSELNIMDGVTATTSELNIMDGVTATTAELNKMDGVTATTAELNVLDGISSIDTDLSSVSGSDDTLASAKAVKAYVDANAGGGGTGNISFSDTTMAGNAMTLDSAGEIALSADDNGEVKFFDGDAHYATMQKDSTQGLKLTAGSDEVAILTTTDTGKLKSTGHTWIQAHHFAFSNLDNNVATYLSWASSNSNQGDIFNHRGLMPCAGRILKCIFKGDSAFSTSTNFMTFELSGSGNFTDVGFGSGTVIFTDVGRLATSTSNYPLDITSDLLSYTWNAGDTITGKFTQKGGSSNKRCQMAWLIEWQV